MAAPRTKKDKKTTAAPGAVPSAADFERAMAELDETVRRLDAGDLPLEESLAAFEKGVALVRSLHARLDAVQMRLDELTQAGDGRSALTPLATPDDDADDDE